MKVFSTRYSALYIGIRKLKRFFLFSILCAAGFTASAQYCTPNGAYSACALTNDFWITSVSFTGTGSTFNFTGGACASGSPFYINTGYTGDVVAGNTYTFSVTRPGSRYKEYYNAWIDYDNNNVLNNTTPFVENIVVNLLASAGGATTLTASVTIPAGVSAGIHRLRVRVQYSGMNANDPCYAGMGFNVQTETKDFNLNVVGGCTPPTVSGTATPNTVCPGDSVTLAGSGAASYTWSGGATDGVAFAPAATKTYTVTGTDSTGCSATSTVNVTVKAKPAVGGSATPNAACTGDSATLNGSGATSYIWSSGVTNGVKFLPASTATYTVTGTTSGCSNTATVTLAVNSIPVVNANASKSAVCSGDTVTLTGSGATSYGWSSGVTDGVAFVPAGTITYTVTGTTSGCSATASVKVTVNPIPAINLGTDVTVCPGDSAQLSVSGDPVGSTYLWTPGTGLSCTGCKNPEVVPASSNLYILVVTDPIGCKGRDSIQVTVPAFSVAAGLVNPKDTTACNGASVDLWATGGSSYLWVPATFLSNAGSPNPTFIALLTTTFTVTVTQGTCSAAASVAVTALPPMPNPYIYQVGDSLHCTTDPTFVSYKWYYDNVPIPGATGTAVFVDTSGNYNVEVVNGDGCNTAVGITVFVGIQESVHGNLVSLYPNPAGNTLYVSGYKLTGSSLLTIYNVLGKVCLQSEIVNPKPEIPVDVSGLSEGVYLLQIKSGSGTITKRFVKK